MGLNRRLSRLSVGLAVVVGFSLWLVATSRGSPLPPPQHEVPDGWRPVFPDTLLWEGFENGEPWEINDLVCHEVMWRADSTDTGVLWRCALPDGGYGDNWLQFLTTPPVSLPSRTPMFLRARVLYDVEGATDELGSDGMNVRASTDMGRTWQLLHAEALPYDCRGIRGFRELDEEALSSGWTGDSGGWRNFEADLSAFAGSTVLIRLACASDQWESGQRYAGWMVHGVVIADSAETIWRETPEQSLTPSCPLESSDDGWSLSVSDYHGPFQSYHCKWSPRSRHALVSPFVDLRSYRRASLSYWYLLDLPDASGTAVGEWGDFYTVEVTADSGATWDLVLCDADSLRPGPGWCRRGADDVSTVVGSLLLDPWVGKMIRIRFVLRSDADAQGGQGLWLDDVAVLGERCGSLPGEVMLSEFVASDTSWAIEIASRLTNPLCLGNWILECDGIEHQLPSDVVLPAGGWFVVRPEHMPDAELGTCVGLIRLLEPTERWEVDRVEYGAAASAPAPGPGGSVASVRDAPRDGSWRWEADPTPTLGYANDCPEPALGAGTLRITEIGLCPTGGDSLFVEVQNLSGTDTVSLEGCRVGVPGFADTLSGRADPLATVAVWLEAPRQVCPSGGAAYLWNAEGRRVDQVGWESSLLASASRGVPRGGGRLRESGPTELAACVPTPGAPNRVLLPPRGGLQGTRANGGIVLRWPPVRDRIEGYNLYRGKVGEPRIGPLNGPSPLADPGFLDEHAAAGSSYVYWLEFVYGPEERYLVDGLTVQAVSDAPQAVVLRAAEPNPFDRTTAVTVSIREPVDVDISLYGPGGRAVRTLFQGKANPGTSRLVWDGTDEQGRRVSPGLYFCRASWSRGTTSVRILVLPGRGA